jgi:hypothetical protein
MFDKAAMAESLEGVGKATMAGTYKAQERASGWVRVGAHKTPISCTNMSSTCIK